MNITDLISGCKAKDKQAERLLFETYAHKVYKICCRYSKDNDQAKDFLQECFIRLFEKLELFDQNKGSFDGWLYKLCVHVVLGQLRKAKLDTSIVYMDSVPEKPIESSSIEQISMEELLEAIRSLPNGYQVIFNLHVFEKWSHREISEDLGITESTSRSQLTRAKKLLMNRVHQNTKKRYAKRLA